MDRSRSLLYSILIHASAVGVASLISTTFDTAPKSETRLSVTLMEPQPSSVQTPPDKAPAPLRPITTPAIKPEAPKSEPLIPAPARSFPIPITESKPLPATTTQNVPQPPVVTVPARPSPAAVAEPPPPPSPVNVQAKYEEENLAIIRAILAQKRTYPKNALRLNQQGDVTLSFDLAPTGEVQNLRIVRSSEFELLDNAAKNLILTCAPEFPKPSATVRITVPIGYSIR